MSSAKADGGQNARIGKTVVAGFSIPKAVNAMVSPNVTGAFLVLGSAGLLVFVVCLLWLVLSAPVGRITVSRGVNIAAERDRIWSAVYPFGPDFGWNGAAVSVTQTGKGTGRVVTSHIGRDDAPIERSIEISNETPMDGFTLHYTDDTSLAQSFWENYRMDVRLEPKDNGTTDVVLAETDRYRGLAFPIYRFFALRRQARKLRTWAETGRFRPGGLFDHPATQFGMAVLSALIIWPFFGLNANGLFLAITLTTVVGMHELGHLAAFRIAGHKSVRMVFLPLLGGIAMGGRPYDKRFEVGFAALMGAGFSAFPVAMLIWASMEHQPGMTEPQYRTVLIVIMIAAFFNLGNLMPVWKFDGGQVLRQIFRSAWGMAGASFAVLAVLVAVGRVAGLPWSAMVVAASVLAFLGVVTARTSHEPKTALTPMSDSERVALGLAFASVVAIHALALAWAARQLF